MTLYLIRHGKPLATWGGDDEDPGLDETGLAQAQAAAEALLALDESRRPLRVVSSPLRRCRETAEPLARALGVDIEIDAAVGEIPTPAALSPADRPAWLRGAFAGTWSEIEGDIDYDLWRRAVARAVAARRQTAIFSHFVAINAAVSVAVGADRVIGFRPDHASITVLDVRDGAPVLVELGRQAVTGVL